MNQMVYKGGMSVEKVIVKTMLKLCVLVFALAAARAAVIQKPGVSSPIGSSGGPIERSPKIDSLSDDISIDFGAEVFDSPAGGGPVERSLGDIDNDSSSSESDSIEDIGIQRRPEVFKTNYVDNIVKRSLRPSQSHGIVSVIERSPNGHGPMKRSLGVMENAGMGALTAAVSTFTNSITSANVASGQVASGGYPQYQYQGYPRPGYQRPGYPRPGYSGFNQEGYHNYPYQGDNMYPNRGTSLSTNVNNINLVNGG